MARDADEFQRRMVQPDDSEIWFAPRLVGDLLTAGLSLRPGECFSFKIPPALGGEFTPDNFEPTDLQVHFNLLGQVHRQIKDLPPGTPIDEIRLH